MGTKHSALSTSDTAVNDISTLSQQQDVCTAVTEATASSNCATRTGHNATDLKSHASPLDLKITNTLKELHRTRENEEKDSSGTHSHNPFTRIMLKFPLVAQAFNSVRSTFEALDKEKKGYIVYKDLEGAFEKLGANFSKEEIGQVFEESDMSENGRLDFKEFLVCLAIGFVLHKIPSLEEGDKLSIFYAPLNSKATKASGEKSSVQSIPFGEGNKLRIAFQLAVDAFLWFDSDGDGLINREEMALRLGTSHAQSPTKKMSHLKDKNGQRECTESVNSMISERRFNEMDWNHDGTIHFKEFLMAFESWVGVDEDEGNE